MTQAEYGERYKDHLLEQYKQSVEIVDRLNQRKDQVNRLYVTLVSALVAASSFAIASWPEKHADKLVPLLPVIISLVGMGLGLAWFITLQALERQLHAKIEVIREMELELPFPIHSLEIEKRNKIGSILQFKLPLPDYLLPLVFVLIFAFLLAWVSPSISPD